MTESKVAMLTAAPNKLRVLEYRIYFAVSFQNLRGIKELVLIKIFGVRYLGRGWIKGN